MFENPINKLRFWCHKVIPLVYDEALSYYEVLCKVAKKINEVITDVNGLHDTVVFQVNGKEPTDGNVQLEAEDFDGALIGSINGITPDENGDATINAEDVGALPDSIDPVESVNGIAPDAQGNVNVGTVKSVNNTLPDASGNVNLPTVAGVTSVDGVGADAQGNVQINAVKSVNGETPNAQGAVTLDVGTVKSVNGETPDAQGNVDVGTVKSVNGVTPTDGGVILTPVNIGMRRTDYYVDGTDGLDTNDGRDWENAFKTINRALAVATGQTYCPMLIKLHIKTGVYNERARSYYWNSCTVELHAEEGEVEIAELLLTGAKQVHFTSGNNQSYGFTFKKNTGTVDNYLASFGFTEVYTECPMKFDPTNDANIMPLNISLGTKFVIGYRGQLTFINIGGTSAFKLDYSYMFNTWGAINTPVNKYDAAHSIVCGVINMTTDGTALTI